jgi:5'-deoxynucleotidase YfbR-like HD superfamily hydrolase
MDNEKPMLVMVLGGEVVDLRHFTEDDVSLELIAHSLARQCRWRGHLSEYRSVAEHSVEVVNRLVADLPNGSVIDTNVLRWALLHDAPETWLSDIRSTLKLLMPGLSELEDEIMKTIWSKLCPGQKVPSDSEQALVKYYDVCDAEREQQELVNSFNGQRSLKCLNPQEAQIAFLHAARTLNLGTWH